MNSVIVNPRAAERILEIPAFSVIDLAISEDISVARVTGKRKLETIDNKKFIQDFRVSRREYGKHLTIAKSNSSNNYQITEKDGRKYIISPQPQELSCSCDDYKNQQLNNMEYPCCAHGYKVLTHLGYTHFRDYVNA